MRVGGQARLRKLAGGEEGRQVGTRNSSFRNDIDSHFLVFVEAFDRALKNVIDSFERAREWADLSNCLQRVRKQIENYKGLPIPRQRDLAKRLSK